MRKKYCWQGYGNGYPPSSFFTTWSSPVARVALYLTDENTLVRWLVWRNVSFNHPTKDSYQNIKTARKKDYCGRKELGGGSLVRVTPRNCNGKLQEVPNKGTVALVCCTRPRLKNAGSVSHRTVHRGGGGTYSFVGCLSHLTIDHSSIPRWSTVHRGWGGLSHIRVHRKSFTQEAPCILWRLQFQRHPYVPSPLDATRRNLPALRVYCKQSLPGRWKSDVLRPLIVRMRGPTV